MNEKLTTIMCGSALGAALLLGAPTAGADPSNAATCQGGSQSCNSWGQAVKACNASDCYSLPNGTTFTNRGGYVSTVAQNPSVGYDPSFSGNGYGGQLHDLAHPGNSSPQGTPGTPGK